MEHPVKKDINELRIFISDHTEPSVMFDHVHVHNEFETVKLIKSNQMII